MKSLVLLTAAIAARTATSIPASAAGKSSDQTHSDDSDSEKKICRRDAAGTGSIMAKRICGTKAEWDAIEEQSQRNVQRMRNMDRSRSSISR